MKEMSACRNKQTKLQNLKCCPSSRIKRRNAKETANVVRNMEKDPGSHGGMKTNGKSFMDSFMEADGQFQRTKWSCEVKIEKKYSDLIGKNLVENWFLFRSCS